MLAVTGASLGVLFAYIFLDSLVALLPLSLPTQQCEVFLHRQQWLPRFRRLHWRATQQNLNHPILQFPMSPSKTML